MICSRITITTTTHWCALLYACSTKAKVENGYIVQLTKFSISKCLLFYPTIELLTETSNVYPCAAAVYWQSNPIQLFSLLLNGSLLPRYDVFLYFHRCNALCLSIYRVCSPRTRRSCWLPPKTQQLNGLWTARCYHQRWTHEWTAKVVVARVLISAMTLLLYSKILKCATYNNGVVV